MILKKENFIKPHVCGFLFDFIVFILFLIKFFSQNKEGLSRFALDAVAKKGNYVLSSRNNDV